MPQSLPPCGGGGPRSGSEGVNPEMQNHNLKQRSRELRQNATRQEQKLWYDFLRTHPIKFRRQQQIGPYIADFFCPSARLVIELDGGGHYDPEAEKKDHERTVALEQQGLKVIRFCNLDIDKNFRAVCESIDREIHKRTTLPQSR